jgi:hypothetical protein
MKKKLLNLMKLRTAMMLAAVVVTFLGLPTKAWADDVASVTIGDGEPMNFASLSDAVSEVNKSSYGDATRKLTLLGNVTNLSSSLSFSHSSTFILDLNGHTLSGSAATLIEIGSNTTLTITDSGTGGTISATGNGKGGSAGLGVVDNKGKLIISGGTITATGSDGKGIFNYCGTLTISGGTISATGSGGIGIDNEDSQTTVTGGTIIGKEFGIYSSLNRSNLFISGGTFKGCNTAIYINIGSFNLNGLPSFGSGDDANTLDIYIRDLITFGAAITDKPAQPIKMELNFSSLPYTFTSGYGTYCKYISGTHNGEVIAPDDFFNVVNAGFASLGLTDGDEVKLYQKDPGDYCGDPNVNEGKDVFWSYNSSTKTLTISGTGAMADYTQLEKVPWSYEDYTTVTIGDNITHIGDNAFNSSRISTVTIPAKVTSIGDKAFYNSSISTVTIPSKVTSIGKNAFKWCTSLTSVVFADGSQLESIGEQAFFRCTTLPSITIPATVKTIGSSAFERCELLQTVTFNAGCLLESIGKYAFSSCSSLESITVPSTMTSIGNNAFYNSALTSMTIPASVTGIGDYAFADCSNLSSVYLMTATPPTLGTEAFNGISGTGILYVRSADYKTTTNWSGYSTKMKVMSTVTIGDDLIISDPNINEGGYYYVEGNEVGVKNADGFDYNTFIVKKTASGETISVTGPDDKGFYSFTMPDEAVTVTALLNKTYALTIAGIQVNDLNKDNILESTGTATVSFTPATETTPNTLTLNGATITGPVKVGLPSLTIDVQGTNSITVPEGNVFKLENDETNLTSNVTCYTTFKTSTADGKLTLTSTSSETIECGGVFYYYSYNDYEAKFNINIDKTIGLIQPTNSYYLTDGTSDYHIVRFAPSLGVSLGDGYGGTKVITEDNAADVFEDGTVSFDKAKNILTLNGASLSAPLSTSLATLTVDLIGENTLRNYYDGHVIETPYGDDATVNIKSTAEDGSLTMTMSHSEDGNMVSGHVDLRIADPLKVLSGKLTGNAGNDITVVIGEVYKLTVAGTAVTFLNKDNVLGDSKITFTPSSNTLTLNGAAITGPIEYGGSTLLTIVLNGINSVDASSNTYAFKGTDDNASIQFVKGDDGCKLTMTVNTTVNPLSFGDGKVSYDHLVYSDGNGMLISEPTPPTMAEDNNKVKLTKDYTDGDIYYTIDYADETADVTKTKYTAEFAMDAPGTVEAWAEANDATSSTAKGKYFGYKDAPFTLKADLNNPTLSETLMPVLIPAFVDGENIGYNGTYESDKTGVATFDGGTITAVGIGTAKVTASLNYTSDVLPVVILNPDKKVTAEVNVGATPSITFKDGMKYATYCNTTGKNLTIPEGLKAYAVSGVNGEVVMLAEVEFLPTSSGTTYFPLLLYRAETSTSVGTAYEYTGTATAPTYTHLRYALENVTTTGKEYVLYNDEFVKATGTILAGARYLDLGGTFARRLSIGSEATGIKAIDNGKWTMDNWYDLQGRRIEKPTKPGLYIKNGQKQIVKQNHELH